LVNIAINWLLAAQRNHFAREDEIWGIDGAEDRQKEFGLWSFIPSSPTDIDQYWHGAAEKCLALSTQMGPPIFFWTLTMNPYWPEYQALKRGSGEYSDATMISLIFNSRLKFIMKDCKSTSIRGRVRAFAWPAEYQQRGFLHVHILFWTGSDTTDLHEMDKSINTRYPQCSSV
jgi:hypothetical protein